MRLHPQMSNKEKAKELYRIHGELAMIHSMISSGTLRGQKAANEIFAINQQILHLFNVINDDYVEEVEQERIKKTNGTDTESYSS